MTPQPSPFPPSFDGNPWTYAFALVSLMLVSSLSLMQLLEYAHEAARLREVRRLLDALPLAEPAPRHAPMSTLTAFRRIIVCFLLMTFIGASPDVLILLAWGEASDRTMEALFLLDRVGDGGVMFPFLAALWLLARTRQALPQQLAKAATIPLGPFHWDMLQQRIKLVAIVLLLAVGVTIGKAYA